MCGAYNYDKIILCVAYNYDKTIYCVIRVAETEKNSSKNRKSS